MEKENSSKDSATTTRVFEQNGLNLEVVGKLRQPLQDVPCSNNLHAMESDPEPMVLDKSLKVADNDSLETNKLSSLLDGYAEDVYIYMRDTEVYPTLLNYVVCFQWLDSLVHIVLIFLNKLHVN